MTNYVWYPVSGDGQTQATGYTWNGAPANWNTGSWAVADALTFSGTTVPGAIPGSGTGNSSGPGLDNVGVVAGNVNALLFGLFYTPNPSKGDPYVKSTDYPVNLTINTGTVNINSLLLAGFNTIASIPRFPTIDVEGATFKLNGSVANNGTLVFGPGNTYAAIGGGTIDIGAGGTVEVAGTVQSSIVTLFKDGLNDFLNLGAVSAATPSAFAGTIAGFATGDTIVLTSVPYSAAELAVYSANMVTVTNGGQVVANLPVSGVYTPTSFQVANVGGNAAIVLCFLPGTHIRTPDSDRPVESLVAGDTVVTLLGAPGRITWTGRRTVDCAKHPNPERVWPVRIAANAFGAGLPARDLHVSPDHAIYVDDVLIPAKHLINGTTIHQVKRDSVTYHHIELERHDVVLAEGLSAETYLDAGDRANFAHGGDTTRLFPDFSTRAPNTAALWETRGCAPLVMSGPKLETARERINAIARARGSLALAV